MTTELLPNPTDILPPVLPIVTTGTGQSSPRLPGLRLALLAGILLWLANPTPSLWPLAWVAIAPLILSVTRARRLRQAMWRGYLFGWVFLGMVWYWIGLTIGAWLHNASPGPMAGLLGWAGWFGLTFILSGFYAVWGGMAWWLRQRVEQGKITGGVYVIGLAAAWVLIESLRTRGTLTMPWAQLSYTQYKFLPVLQVADITGAYGVSFLIMLVNGAVAWWWTQRGKQDSARYLWASLTTVVMVCIYGIGRLMQPDIGRPLPVAAMQGGFNSLQSDFNPAPVTSPSEQYDVFTNLTARASAASPRPALYVWAESAAPGDALHDGRVLSFMTSLARDTKAAVITGSTLTETRTEKRNSANGANTRMYEVRENASVLFTPNSHVSKPAYYVKRQLVPFGEFIPFRDLIPEPVSQTFQFPSHDDVTGEGATVLSYTDAMYGRVDLGPFICYEAMFPPYAREMTQKGATLLVTQSNDSWFQSRAAMEQHLAAVVLRTIENRRETVRSTTTGVTCFLDSRGRVLDKLPLNQVAYGVRTMQMLSDKTLYTRLGDWFPYLCLLFLLSIVEKTGRDKPRGIQRLWRKNKRGE